MGILLRGRVLFVIVALLLVPNLSFVHKPEIQVLASSDISNGWPMFRHDSYRTGRSTSKAPDDYLLWQFETGNSILSSPVVADGKTYIGSEDGKLYCLNASTGTPIWNYTTGGSIFSSPAVAYSNVYVGSRDGYLYCLNAYTGDFKWQYQTGTSPQGSSIESSPAVANGWVYVGAFDYSVHCLNAYTGDLKWSYKTGKPVTSSPAIVDNRVFIGSRDGYTYCFNAYTGDVVWSSYLGIIEFSSPAFAERGLFTSARIYIGSTDGNLYCLEADNGNLVWGYNTGDYVYSSPAVANGKVYVGSYNNKLYCLGFDSPLVLTVHTSGVSSYSPVTIFLNETSVGTASDVNPLTITLWERMPLTLLLSVDNMRVWGINPASQYSFRGWSDVDIGGDLQNPRVIKLNESSAYTANYQIQHLTTITLEDNGGNVELNPTQIEAYAPNSSLIRFSSFVDQWMDNGTWILQRVIWHDTNVKPVIDPIYETTPGGTWNVSCRVYPIDFTVSFKDGNGTALYPAPSSLTLTFPNGTTSVPLTVGLYLIQNGTTTWSSIIWQETDVVPRSTASPSLC